MAPQPPLGRALAMKHVRDGRLPVSFGSPHPVACILWQDGVLRIRQLVVDPEEEAASREAALAKGGPWQPEHYYDLGRPTGVVYAEAPTTEAMLERMQAMEWPASW
jgi:hypothetical protein